MIISDVSVFCCNVIIGITKEVFVNIVYPIKNKEKIAQGILDARALYPECSLADLYDELTMPPELRKAHQENDKAVMEAYGFKVKDKESGKMRWLTESETIAELMKMYQLLTGV